MVRRDRVEARLRALGINQFEAAKRAGKQLHFVYDLLKGKKQTIKGDGLLHLAKALECSIEYLTGEADTPGVPPGELPNEGSSPVSIPYSGIVEIGAFRLPGVQTQPPQVIRERLLTPDPRYPSDQQCAYLVNDDSLASHNIGRGTFLICVKVPTADELPNGSIVIVERRRLESGEVEISAREVQHFPSRTELRPPAGDSVASTIVLRNGKAHIAGEEVRVVAAVISAVIPLPPI